MWDQRLHRDFEVGMLIQRRLLDEGGCGLRMICRPVEPLNSRGDSQMPRRTNGRDVGSQVAQENSFRNDGREARALSLQRSQQGPIDRIGLQECVGNASRWLAVQEQFPGRGAFKPAEDDRATVCLDRLRGELGGHFVPLDPGLDG
jgi:hypothetical protein